MASAASGSRRQSSGTHHQIAIDAARAFHFDICSTWCSDYRSWHSEKLTRLLCFCFCGSQGWQEALQPADEEVVRGAAGERQGVSFSPFSGTQSITPASAAAAHFQQQQFAYFQGFHEVTSVCLLAWGMEEGAFIACRALQLHFRGFAQKDMQAAEAFLGAIPCLLQEFDPELDDFLRKEVGIEVPHFSLSWILTWFSHNVSSFTTVRGIFSWLMRQHPLASCYLATAILISRRDFILGLEPEFGPVFAALQALPGEAPRMKLHRLLQNTERMLQAREPLSLLQERMQVQHRTVLKEQWPQLFSWPPAALAGKEGSAGAAAAAVRQGPVPSVSSSSLLANPADRRGMPHYYCMSGDAKSFLLRSAVGASRKRQQGSAGSAGGRGANEHSLASPHSSSSSSLSSSSSERPLQGDFSSQRFYSSADCPAVLQQGSGPASSSSGRARGGNDLHSSSSASDESANANASTSYTSAFSLFSHRGWTAKQVLSASVPTAFALLAAALAWYGQSSGLVGGTLGGGSSASPPG